MRGTNATESQTNEAGGVRRGGTNGVFLRKRHGYSYRADPRAGHSTCVCACAPCARVRPRSVQSGHVRPATIVARHSRQAACREEGEARPRSPPSPPPRRRILPKLPRAQQQHPHARARARARQPRPRGVARPSLPASAATRQRQQHARPETAGAAGRAGGRGTRAPASARGFFERRGSRRAPIAQPTCLLKGGEEGGGPSPARPPGRHLTGGAWGRPRPRGAHDGFEKRARTLLCPAPWVRGGSDDLRGRDPGPWDHPLTRRAPRTDRCAARGAARR